MKYKVLTLVVLAALIYSCASKSTIPTKEVTKVEPTVTATTVMTTELAEGKTLYENNCAKCHDLYNTKEFSDEAWKPIVIRMQKKAHLDDIQGQKIYNYVTMK